jgi:hypothetical protein
MVKNWGLGDLPKEPYMAKRKPIGGRLLRKKRMRKKALSPIKRGKLKRLFALIDEVWESFERRPSIFASRGGRCRTT